VSPEIQEETSHVRRDTDVRVRLRERRFNAATAALGAGSEQARARLIGVDERTIRRAKAGIIGEVFIARVLLTFQDHIAELGEIDMTATFEDFFEVATADA
jgi:hypothetical protein